MENRNVKTMSAEALEEARIDLGKKATALPNRFDLNGFEITWQETTNYDTRTNEKGNLEMVTIPSLRIFSTNHRELDFSLEIDTNGTVQGFSFHSTSGKGAADAEESRKYFDTCTALLSDNFRNALIADYNAKLETLNSLKAEYKEISDEEHLRHEEAIAAKKEAEAIETRNRRNRVESFGAVWFDYAWSDKVRYTVKDTTEKTILFHVWSFNTSEGKWVMIEAKRISKHLLGQKPARSYRNSPKVMVCPVGTNDLNSQTTERPETIEY
jgi:hypothetical protein